MYSHFLIVSLYLLAFILVPKVDVVGHGYLATVLPWGDLQDLVLLAWKSKPAPELRSESSVKITSRRTWQRRVAIRVDSDGQVHLVSGIDRGIAKLTMNGRYTLLLW
ncbi:hypothetical protein QBC38DRAFT_155058 [Podospora fimiseda]|uniref:Uncharacterized protein n=1 Tax=Podospora fimiseda TaxID=252190 RepID=A0AAN6YNE7_9PEZI|nr:hypothetical protein QBC38DRAFT_155058 [Podospora fimiseda]